MDTYSQGIGKYLEETFSLNSTIGIHSHEINTPFMEGELALSVCVCCIADGVTQMQLSPTFQFVKIVQ